MPSNILDVLKLNGNFISYYTTKDFLPACLTQLAYFLYSFRRLIFQVVNKKVAAGLEEIGHTSTAKYIEKCAALWELLNSKTLVKIGEAGAYMLVSHVVRFTTKSKFQNRCNEVRCLVW